MSGIIIEDFKPVAKNTLVGFVRARLQSGMVVSDIAVHRKGDRTWASPPGKPMVGRDGTQIKDKDGKPQFTPVITFVDRATGDKFSEAVLAALRASHPGALS